MGRRTNQAAHDSALVLRDYVYFMQQTPEAERGIAGGIVNAERYYNLEAGSETLTALNAVPAIALGSYLELVDGRTD
jgi:hypothetical protein